jgi:hypothetical protein
MEIKVGDNIKVSNIVSWLKVVRIIQGRLKNIVYGCVEVLDTTKFHKINIEDIIEVDRDEPIPSPPVIEEEDEYEDDPYGFEVDRSYFEMSEDSQSGGGGGEGDEDDEGEGDDEESDGDEDGENEGSGDEDGDEGEDEGEGQEGDGEDGDQDANGEGSQDGEGNQPSDSEERSGRESGEPNPDGKPAKIIKTYEHDTNLTSEKIKAPVKKKRF